MRKRERNHGGWVGLFSACGTERTYVSAAGSWTSMCRTYVRPAGAGPAVRERAEASVGPACLATAGRRAVRRTVHCRARGERQDGRAVRSPHFCTEMMGDRRAYPPSRLSRLPTGGQTRLPRGRGRHRWSRAGWRRRSRARRSPARARSGVCACAQGSQKGAADRTSGCTPIEAKARARPANARTAYVS